MNGHQWEPQIIKFDVCKIRNNYSMARVIFPAETMKTFHHGVAEPRGLRINVWANRKTGLVSLTSSRTGRCRVARDGAQFEARIASHSCGFSEEPVQQEAFECDVKDGHLKFHLPERCWSATEAEKIRLVKQLRDEKGMSVREIAAAVGFSKSKVNRLQNLDEEPSHAESILQEGEALIELMSDWVERVRQNIS